MANKETADYILGINQYELERLGFQHGVWKEVTDTFLDKLGIQPGWKVLDVGAGPGFVSADIRQCVGASGEVTALEPSEMYLNYFKKNCNEKHWTNIKYILSDVENADLPENYYDLIFARWVIGFVPDPELFISKLKKSLKPGGIIAFQDYAFHGLFLYPRGGQYDNLSPAVEAYWKYTDGDLSIAVKIPLIFKKLGIELLEYKPNSLAGGPDTGIFKWHDSFITHHVPLMIEKGIISKEKGDAILMDWQEHTNNPDSLFFSPLVVNVSGKKS